jgi:hypothetical protein
MHLWGEKGNARVSQTSSRSERQPRAELTRIACWPPPWRFPRGASYRLGLQGRAVQLGDLGMAACYHQLTLIGDTHTGTSSSVDDDPLLAQLGLGDAHGAVGGWSEFASVIVSRGEVCKRRGSRKQGGESDSTGT